MDYDELEVIQIKKIWGQVMINKSEMVGVLFFEPQFKYYE